MLSFTYENILICFCFFTFSESSVPPDRGSGKSGNSEMNQIQRVMVTSDRVLTVAGFLVTTYMRIKNTWII